MSGIPEHNFPLFTEAAASLRKHGFDVLSPHEILHGGTTHFNDNYTHADYIRADIKSGLMECDALVLLPGWPSSAGAMAEMHVAAHMGYEIFYYHEWPNGGFELVGMS
jgi:hypothetical protein